MKKMILALFVFSNLLAYSAQASCGCSGGGSEICEVAPYIMMLSITSAPTGTLMLTSDGIACRDEFLGVREEAVRYKVTGEASPLLQSMVTSIKKVETHLTSEQIISKIISVK